MEDQDQDQDQDQGDTEAGQQEEDRETRRREPHHRQINRMRLLRENTEPVHSPEDNPSFSPKLTKEKTLVEILLRKYGFGQWSVDKSDCNIFSASKDLQTKSSLALQLRFNHVM